MRVCVSPSLLQISAAHFRSEMGAWVCFECSQGPASPVPGKKAAGLREAKRAFAHAINLQPQNPVLLREIADRWAEVEGCEQESEQARARARVAAGVVS